ARTTSPPPPSIEAAAWLPSPTTTVVSAAQQTTEPEVGSPALQFEADSHAPPLTPVNWSVHVAARAGSVPRAQTSRTQNAASASHSGAPKPARRSRCAAPITLPSPLQAKFRSFELPRSGE